MQPKRRIKKRKSSPSLDKLADRLAGEIMNELMQEEFPEPKATKLPGNLLPMPPDWIPQKPSCISEAEWSRFVLRAVNEGLRYALALVEKEVNPCPQRNVPKSSVPSSPIVRE